MEPVDLLVYTIIGIVCWKTGELVGYFVVWFSVCHLKDWLIKLQTKIFPGAKDY